MEEKDTLPCSQEPAIEPYPQPVEYSLFPPGLHHNVIYLSVPRSCYWSRSFRVFE